MALKKFKYYLKKKNLNIHRILILLLFKRFLKLSFFPLEYPEMQNRILLKVLAKTKTLRDNKKLNEN